MELDFKLNLDMQKKFFFVAFAAYDGVCNHDIPGFLPMMLLGTILYDNFSSKKARNYYEEHSMYPEQEASCGLMLSNLVVTSSLLCCYMQYNTSVMLSILGLIVGEYQGSKIEEDTLDFDSNIFTRIKLH